MDILQDIIHDEKLAWKKSLDDAARARAEARLEQQKGGGSGTTTEKKFDWKGLSGDMGFEWILGIGLVAALTDLDELWRALSMGISSITKVIGGFWKDLKLLGTQMFGKDSFFSQFVLQSIITMLALFWGW